MLMDALEIHDDTEVFEECARSAVYEDFRVRSFEAVAQVTQRSRAEVTCFKPVCDSHLIGRFLDRFEEGCFLWMYRSCRDSANSTIRKFAGSDRAIRITCEGGSGGGWLQEGVSPSMLRTLQSVYRPDLDRFELSCLTWWARNRIAIEQDIAASDRVMFLSYEDLVSDGVAQIQRVFDFLGLRFLPKTIKHMHTRSIRKNPPPPLDAAIMAMCDELDAELRAAHSRNERSRSMTAIET